MQILNIAAPNAATDCSFKKQHATEQRGASRGKKKKKGPSVKVTQTQVGGARVVLCLKGNHTFPRRHQNESRQSIVHSRFQVHCALTLLGQKTAKKVYMGNTGTLRFEPAIQLNIDVWSFQLTTNQETIILLVSCLPIGHFRLTLCCRSRTITAYTADRFHTCAWVRKDSIQAAQFYSMKIPFLGVQCLLA